MGVRNLMAEYRAPAPAPVEIQIGWVNRLINRKNTATTKCVCVCRKLGHKTLGIGLYDQTAIGVCGHRMLFSISFFLFSISPALAWNMLSKVHCRLNVSCFFENSNVCEIISGFG